jgi:precorrin-2/cobalt-factor-2 C20-methyltransferase
VKLIGVGMGPGDPELVTVKAVRVLATAGRVFVPVLDSGDTGRAEATVRAHAAHDRVERLVFALNERADRERRERHWDAAGERVARWLRDTGGTAAFATIGDPNIYSTFGYLAQTVRDLVPEVVVETVPGITAMQALSAASGTCLVEGAEPLVLLPLAQGVAPLKEALSSRATVVAYKGGRHLSEIAAIVRDAGRPAVYGAHLGLSGERIADLSDMDDGPAGLAAPYLSTVLVPARRETRGGKL